MAVAKIIDDDRRKCIDCKQVADTLSGIDHEDWCLGVR
jgi:hypothetical protein